MNGTSFLQAVLKTDTGLSAPKKAVLLSVISVPTAFEALILLHSFFVLSRVIKSMAVRSHMLPATGNMIEFAVPMLAMAFTAFAIAAVVGLKAQLLDHYLWFDHDLREFKMLGSRADGYAPLQQCTSLEASIGPMHDGPGEESAALHLSPREDDAFQLLTTCSSAICTASYLLLVCSRQLSMAEMRWGMYHVEEGAILLRFRSLSDAVAEPPGLQGPVLPLQ